MNVEYGEIMRFLLHHQERFRSEDEFRLFLRTEIKKLVKDLREYDIVISVLPECLKQEQPSSALSRG